MFEYNVKIKEQKLFQGTDVAQALADAEQLLRVCEKFPEDLGLDWQNLPARIRKALAVVTTLEFEISEERRRYLQTKARELASVDYQTIVAMTSTAAVSLFIEVAGPEQMHALVLGNMALSPPWWSNLPGGSRVLDWADDFSDSIRETYEECLMDQMFSCHRDEREHVGSLDTFDNCLWVRVAESKEA